MRPLDPPLNWHDLCSSGLETRNIPSTAKKQEQKRGPGASVTEYLDPCEILSPALISQKKWAPHTSDVLFFT